MMHRICIKIVAAGLVILGEGAFASESNERSDNRHEASSNAVHISQPAVLDDIRSKWEPSLAGFNTLRPDIDPTYQAFVRVTVPVSNLFKYHPFNPRAPPVPAN